MFCDESQNILFQGPLCAVFINDHQALSTLRLLKMGHSSTKFGFVTMTNSHIPEAAIDGRWVLAGFYPGSRHAQTAGLLREAAS